MQKIESILSKYLLPITLLICIPAVWALFVPGYFGASDDLHVAWLYEMDKVVKFGQFPPRFVPDLSYQFGYPLFNFVFPLPFYLGEIFHFMGLNFVDSVKAVFLISIPLSFVFMYKLMRQFSGVLLSLAGATLYIYTPYRATDLYVRGAIGEIVAFVFLPLIGLSIIKIINSKTWDLKWIGFGALSIAALVLTHDITAYMTLPFLALLSLGLLFNLAHKKTAFLSLLLTGVLGLVVSLYFWLPAIIDSKLMKYDTVFNFQDHFPTLMQLIKPYWGYGASVPGPYDGMSFFVGVVNWIGFLVGAILLFIFRKKLSKQELILLIWSYGVFLVAIFMMDFRSTPIWKVTPELPYFQFPWRFLILTTFLSPLFLIVLEKIRFSKFIGLGLILVIIAINSFQFRPHDFLGRDDQYFLNKYIPFPQASQEYKLTQEEYLRLPLGTTTRPDKIYPVAWANDNQAVNGMQNGLRASITTNFSTSQNLSYNKYNFPGWVATIDGQKAPILTGQPFGQVTTLVPAGPHQVEFKFQETNLKFLLDLISLLGLGVAILLAASSYLNLRKKLDV